MSRRKMNRKKVLVHKEKELTDGKDKMDCGQDTEVSALYLDET